MELIDKEKVVEEIERYISNYKEIVVKTDRNDSTWVDSVSMIDAKIDVLQHLLFFLDTLKGEQKPTWSEEDDAYKLFAISEVEDYYDEKKSSTKSTY